MAVSAAEAARAVAKEHQDHQNRVRRAQAAAIARLYRQINPDQPIKDWIAGLGSEVYSMIAVAQEQAASEAGAYVDRSLAAQGIAGTRPGVDAKRFAGIASDNRPLDTLIAGAPMRTANRRRNGASKRAAITSGEKWLAMVADTQIADASRAATATAIATTRDARITRVRRALSTTQLSPEREAKIAAILQRREDLVAEAAQDEAAGVPEQKAPQGRGVSVGYVRMLQPPSCARCVILAGTWYRWNTGFKRHPMCFPAGTMVSGPGFEAATRRWYQGELVTIGTASGKRLSLTGNHPVLTDRGWIPASLLQPGDQVFDGTGAKSGLGRVPDEQHVPARVEDVFGALRVSGNLAQVPAAAEHFHGDGLGGEVDVVLTDGLLGRGFDTGGQQGVVQSPFGGGIESALDFASERALFEELLTALEAPGGFVGGGGLDPALLGSHPAGAHLPGFLHSAQGDVASLEVSPDHAARYAVDLGERQFALSGEVAVGGVGGQGEVAARWDAPPVPFTMQSAGGYARRGKDLILRLSGQVSQDRVVQVDRVEWSGHVYSLMSTEGWMVADGIVTSNCDCIHIPASEALRDDLRADPMAYFRSLSAEQQDYYFGKANSAAIRDGADIFQVVNAQRKGAVFTADDGRRYTRSGTRKSDVRRPTVWQIMRDAKGSREEAQRLLRLHRYITAEA